ncbi:MAG: hypothetical protein IKS90_03470 [Clostridia bacterium]|nr:hypothetical protein [Clostridia bacterium]
MIEGIGIALQSYHDTAISAKAILESAIAQINANYIGAMLAEKTKEAKEIYNSTLAESRTENYDACLAILDEVAGQAKKIVEQPVPSDFISTLEALKQMKEPTKTEIETVVGAYKNNYFAYRAICDFLKLPKPVTVDVINDDIADIKSGLYKCFYSYNVEAYRFRNWIEGNILASYDEVFRAFCEGRFEDAVQSEQGKDDGIEAEKLNNNG